MFYFFVLCPIIICLLVSIIDFASDDCALPRYMGTITGISDLDPVRWPNSHWRSVKVCLKFLCMGVHYLSCQ